VNLGMGTRPSSCWRPLGGRSSSCIKTDSAIRAVQNKRQSMSLIQLLDDISGVL